MSDALHLLPVVLAASWRIAFLTAGAPVIGAVLLLAIGRVTGADWRPLNPLAAMAPWLVPAGVLLGLCALAMPVPEHLSLWMSWWGVGLRALVTTGALAFASSRLQAGTRVTGAAIILTLYALLATPIASDWMLGQAPRHPVSAIGMMQVTQSLAGGTAVVLAGGIGPPGFRSDMARLMIAAVLGLGYLAFMDYLIVWYSDLPSRVGFYVVRSSPTMGLLVCAALAVGVAAPILLLWLSRERWSQRLAGLAVLAALFLFNVWWIGGGVPALLIGLLLTLAAATAATLRGRPSGEHHV
ncbi:hypothetical protein AB3M93_15610 [Novosphingobium panipatense]|jgi:hypothetical protein|uniref:hypothetical protein n=1 Tax=Novosphingobium TaxID=165696 RepID=UPI000CDA1FB9|nr:hypothetical protein [Novosphingobium sp. HII-3]